MKVLPKYNGGSIVNLIASIQKALGGRPKYPTAKLLPPKELTSKNIVLLLIDALGLDYIEKYGKNSFLRKHMIGKLTSVFPSETTACLTSIATGVPVTQHGILSWFMFVKEFGTIIRPLAFNPWLGGAPISITAGVDAKKWFSLETIYEKIKSRSYTLINKEFANSDYTKATSKGSKVVGSSSLTGLCKSIEKTVKTRGRKYVYAYWHKFDALCHDHGTKSRKVKAHYIELNQKIEMLTKKLRGTDTTLIVTADHGQIDVPKGKTLFIQDYPKIKKCLAMPLPGGGRATFCYVRPNKVAEFKKLVKKKWGGKFTLYPSNELIKKGYFGNPPYHPNLEERVGDFILLGEQEYCLKERIYGKEREILKGMHGGLSKEEMIVPVVMIQS